MESLPLMYPAFLELLLQDYDAFSTLTLQYIPRMFTALRLYLLADIATKALYRNSAFFSDPGDIVIRQLAGQASYPAN